MVPRVICVFLLIGIALGQSLNSQGMIRVLSPAPNTTLSRNQRITIQYGFAQLGDGEYNANIGVIKSLSDQDFWRTIETGIKKQHEGSTRVENVQSFTPSWSFEKEWTVWGDMAPGEYYFATTGSATLKSGITVTKISPGAGAVKFIVSSAGYISLWRGLCGIWIAVAALMLL
ncbi:uncharacterized protein VTP21DRAFT_6495 [Calcarisporiella thermophila]|uniref:uncharacterized protein n=1 Tax=Calcarisporiella thermophila TaxID=911321 RepID=UPI003741FABD